MIVCRTCGGHNADGDTFCGSCGEFLEWTGEKLQPEPEPPEPAAPAAPPSPAPSVPAPSAPATPSRPAVEPDPPPAAEAAPAAGAGAAKPVAGGVTSSVGGFKPAVGGFTPAVGGFKPAVGGPTTGAGAKPAGPPPTPPVREPAPEPKAGPDAGQRAAAALVAPPSPSTGPRPPTVPRQPDRGQLARKPQPQEMRPQAPVRRRPTPPPVQTPPTRQPQPDDLICGMCGESNPPTRRFCSRCGDSLQTAAVVPTPWWRKVLQYFTQRRVHPAGARPRRRPQLLTLRGLNSAFRRVLLVAALLAGLLYALFPSLRGAVNELAAGAVDRIASALGQKEVPVRPLSTEAGAQVPEHPGKDAFDGLNNTFWKAPNADAKPTLVLKFDRPTHVERAIVHNGASADEFGVLARPRQLHVVYFDGVTPSGVFDVRLEDKPDAQEVAFGRGDTATRIEIQVTDVYRSPDSPDLGLTEIELFERQS